MKKLLGLFSLAILSVIAVQAQDQTVLQGATHSYGVTNSGTGYTYNWVLSGGGTLSSATGSGVNIVWNTPGTYTITMREDNNGCATDNTFSVQVNATPTVSFALATSTDCPSADFSLDLAYTGLYPINVTYTAGATTTTVAIADAGALANAVLIPAAERGDLAADYTVSVTLDSATGPGGAALNLGADHTHTVNDTPTTNAIQAL